MKKLYLAAVAGGLGLFTVALWKNNRSYSWKSTTWRCIKSGADTLLVLLAAFYMPALLVAWCVVWVTRRITRKSIQVTTAVILGALFHAVSGMALEVLCILSIFSVDLLSGSQGIYGWWTKPIPDRFLPSFNPARYSGRHNVTGNAYEL